MGLETRPNEKRVENTAVFENPCLKRFSNTDANFLNPLHIDKAPKTRGDKRLYLITNFTKQTLNLNYLCTYQRPSRGVDPGKPPGICTKTFAGHIFFGQKATTIPPPGSII